MSQSPSTMKQPRRLSLLAFDLALLGALLGGCASPPPGSGTVSVARHAPYVARPEFADLVPLTPRRHPAVCRATPFAPFDGLVPLTPDTGRSFANARRRPGPPAPARAEAAAASWVPTLLDALAVAPAVDSAAWVPSRVPMLATAPSVDPVAWVPAREPVQSAVGRMLSLDARSGLPAAASLEVSANLYLAEARYSPDAVAEAFDLAIEQETAATRDLDGAAAQTEARTEFTASESDGDEPDGEEEESDGEEADEDEEEDSYGTDAEEDSYAEAAEIAEEEAETGSAEDAEPAPAVEPPASRGGEAAASEPMASPSPAAAPKIPWKTETYSLVARAMDLRQVLETFGVAQAVSTIMSPAVGGAISGEFADVPCGEFLDRICSLHNLAWYWDGATLWIYAASEMQTMLLDLRYMKAGEVRAMLAELGVEDPRFPLKTASRDELIMVSGPPRYVMLVAEMIQKADVLRERRTFTEVETRIFPLQNTWADDVSFNAGSPESSGSIKGVASMLQQIVGKLSTPGARPSGETNAPAAFQPLITAENRLNAVIVTDVAPRMPLYERLIKELDVPQKLLEIEVTVVEMSRKDALDWQLSIAGTGTKDRLTGAAGQNAGNLFEAEDLAGRGLAGALTYLGSKSTVSASLTALRDKGKARNVSRTTLLTVNNLAAELSDQQSYHARIIGTEVAELAEVSAGTTLQVKPRIMRDAGPDGAARIWLTLSLHDGGFESVSVDSMPMSRSSTLDTQTSVYEDDTIVLAGYLRDIEESAGWGIPLLRDLPLIGWLFGGHSSKTETVQRLFLISPRIVDADAEDLARIQAMRLRDIEEMEDLQEDAADLDEVRQLRDLDRQERRERREDALKDRLGERKRELERAREERARLRREREAELRKTEGRGGCLPW